MSVTPGRIFQKGVEQSHHGIPLPCRIQELPSLLYLVAVPPDAEVETFKLRAEVFVKPADDEGVCCRESARDKL